MTDRDSIIRKLNSLRDLANHPSTEPALVESAMRKFNKLMEEYNLTLTDLEVRSTKINAQDRDGKGKNNAKERSPMGWLVLTIAELTDTVLVANQGYNSWTFLGMPSDTQYATFLFDIINNAMEQGAVAYKMTRDYHNRMNEGKKGPEAILAFKHGFRIAIYRALKEMLDEKNGKGQALILLKKEIILAQMNGAKPAGSTGKDISINTAMSDVVKMGFKEGEKVKLRKETTNETEIKGYIA